MDKEQLLLNTRKFIEEEIEKKGFILESHIRARLWLNAMLAGIQYGVFLCLLPYIDKLHIRKNNEGVIYTFGKAIGESLSRSHLYAYMEYLLGYPNNTTLGKAVFLLANLRMGKFEKTTFIPNEEGNKLLNLWRQLNAIGLVQLHTNKNKVTTDSAVDVLLKMNDEGRRDSIKLLLREDKIPSEKTLQKKIADMLVAAYENKEKEVY